MAADCIFCKIIRGEIPADTLYEDDDVLAFRDLYPQAPIHFLVIPKKHLAGPAEITAEDDRLAGKIMRIGAKVAKREGLDHYRIVFNNGSQAGQTVFHIHMHVLGGRTMGWPPG